MISHQEAEILTSARQDAPLDPMVERELQAHLATCDQCRAFASATERLTAGLRTLPTVAANPRIKREVMTRVRAGRNPLASLLGGFGSGFQPGPALAAVAFVALIGLFGWIAMDRLFFEDGSDGNNQVAAVPTEAVTREAANPTATTPVMPTATTAPEPSATTAPEPTATNPAEPTATTAPAPTATTAAEPTATTAPAPTATTAPVPTAATAPEPTATTAPPPTATTAPEPTATTAPQPTETEAASVARTTEEGPVDLTSSTEITIKPTETAVPPTETAVPTSTDVPPTETPAPTATDVPPTETPVPTETPMPTATDAPPTETPEPVPSPTPGIEPMEGSTSVPVEQGDNAAETGIGSANSDATVPTTAIEPGQNGEAASSVTPPATESAGDGTGGTEEPVGIELIGTDGETTNVETATAETTADATIDATGAADATTAATETVESGPTTETLAAVSEPYQGIVGDPSEQLGLTRDGRLEFVTVPDGASMTTTGGYRLQSADVQPGVVNLCAEGVCEPGMAAPDNAEGWQGDVPMGTVDGTVYILRLYADRSEVYTASADGTQLVDVSLASQIGPTSPPAAVYESGGILYAWLPSGQWLEMAGGSVQALSGSYANPSNVRFAPSANGGPLIGYFSGGTLVVAPVGSPDSAILTLPADGVDFDISPPGDQVALIQGNSIVIYDMQGNQLAMYDGEGMQPGSLIWLRSGIVWVDRNDGTLYQIPETAP